MKSAEYSKFVRCIEENQLIPEGKAIVAAVSGGADSVCMLLLLVKFYTKDKIIAAHFNHMIRGEEADSDEAFVRDLCDKLSVRFVSGSANIPELAASEGRGLEETARKYRYEFLNKLASEENAVVAAAHNADDLAETVLMHIFRGSTVNGLKGISYIQGNVVRPVLDLTREETERVCRDEGIAYRTDSTNSDTSYTRNYVRLSLLPLLNERFGGNVSEALIRLSAAAKNDCDYIDSAADSAYGSVVSEEDSCELISKISFRALHPAVAGRIALRAISSVRNQSGPVYPFGIDVTEKMISRLCEFIRTGKTGTSIELGRNVIAVSEYKNVRLCIGKEESDILHTYSLKISELSVEEAEARSDYPGGDGEKRIFFDKISLDEMQKCGTMVLRMCREGDWMYPFGMSGKKKLNRIFSDSHISVLERSRIPVLAIGDEVLWVYGIKKSDRNKITDQTKKVCMIELEVL